MPIRRMLPFLLINVVVSAVVVLTILYFWDSRQPSSAAEEVAVRGTVAAEQGFVGATAVTPIFVPPTETPAPADEGPTIHVVSAGDTLGIIAGIYDVTIEDIMEANGLTNPNILSVGQQLVIPLDGLPVEEEVAEETAVPAQNVLPTPIATAAVPQGNDIVVEITAVIGVGQLENEAVQIRNTGTDPVALLGWKLADRNGHVYTFGQATLFGNSVDILVHTPRGLNGATDYYWGLAEAVWEPGELVTLLDSKENIMATYEIPLQ